MIALTSLLSLARLSEAFLVLRAQELKLELIWIPLVMVVMSATYSLSSYPAGVWASRVGRRTMLVASLVALMATQYALAWLPGQPGLWTGVALWGVHVGLSQGGLSATVADLAPRQLRPTAFGIFHFATGLFQLTGGPLAGWLLDAARQPGCLCLRRRLGVAGTDPAVCSRATTCRGVNASRTSPWRHPSRLVDTLLCRAQIFWSSA